MPALVLRLPDSDNLFTIEIAYISKAKGPKYNLFSTYEKEFYAILVAVKKWQHYLWGQHFIIKIDQKALQHLFL